MARDIQNQMVKETAEVARNLGYKVKETYSEIMHDNFVYAYKGADMYCIQPTSYYGIEVTYEYVPSSSSGSSCACYPDWAKSCETNSEYLTEVPTAEQLATIFANGIRFAEELGAQRYKTEAEVLKRLG